MFNNNSTYGSCAPVLDLYDGDLKTLFNIVENNQFTLIYIYADWCGRSVNFRHLYQNLSCKYSSQIKFVAINCFNRVGECKKTFNYVKFPNIVLHVRDNGYFSYYGVFDYEYLSNYLNTITRPIHVIDSLESALDFILINDVRCLIFNY